MRRDAICNVVAANVKYFKDEAARLLGAKTPRLFMGLGIENTVLAEEKQKS